MSTTLTLPVSIAKDRKPCGGCGHHTLVRVNGKPGHWACVAPADARAAFPDLAAKLIDPRLLHDLETIYAPKRKIDGHMRVPYWRPPAPEIQDLVTVPAHAWRREYTGPTVILDRSGSWISAASSVDVAHGPLVPTGAGYRGRPGYYKVTVYPWSESGTPHPLAGHEGQETAWVPQPRAALLHQLAGEGRWPDGEPLDSYTGDPVRLDRWATHVNTLRAAAIGKYGRESKEYDAVKVAFSQAVALMIGSREPGKGRVWRCQTHRPDWSYAIQDLAAVTMWRWVDDCGQTVPEHPPVAVQNQDELVLPAAALSLVVTRERSRGRKPLQLDPTGIKLGTFKVKSMTGINA